jgi:nucleotide-binding universal stress UspA family protein
MKTILLATDFSPRSDRALRRATMLARKHGARIVLLHVIDDDRPRHLLEIEKSARTPMLNELAATVQSMDQVGCEPCLRFGNPFEVIILTAEEMQADLIVMGPHRRHALKDMFTGTTVERVVRNGTKPALVACALPSRDYACALLASDMSEGSSRAIAAARKLGLLRDLRIGVVHAFDAPAQALMLRNSTTSAELKAYIEAQRREAADELAIFLRRAKVKPDFRMVELPDLSVAGLIDDCAREQQADLVVVGTQGRSALGRLLLGSIAEEVLRGSSVDVLAVPSN